MAFSKDFLLEIDSTYRSPNSISSTNYEFRLPYSFPTVSGQTRITLAFASVPESYYNIPGTILTGSTGSGFLAAGRYNESQLAAAMQTLMQTTFGWGATATCTYDSIAGAFTFNDTTSARTITNTTGNSLFAWMGFASPVLAFGAAGPGGLPTTSTSVPSLNLERENNIYIRISNLDNKVMLPWVPNQIFSFSIPLTTKNSKNVFNYESHDISVAQTMYLSQNHLRSNSQIKVQLVWNDGTVVNLNGRNWSFTLKIEQDENKMYY